MIRNLDESFYQEDYVIKKLNNNYFEDALLKYSVKDYEGTKKELLSILKNSTDPDIYYLLGLTEYHLNSFSSSIKYFSKFIELKPSTFECGFCYLHRGECYLLLENLIMLKMILFML